MDFTIFLIIGIAALVSYFLVPPVSWIARLLDAVDRPGGRRPHKGIVPRLGGLAIGAGVVFGLGTAAAVQWRGWPEGVAALAIGTALVFLLGLVDDVTGLSALTKLLGQLTAAILVAAGGWHFEVLGLPGGLAIELGPSAGVLTVLWIVGVTNAINFLDGLDGLAAGVSAIIAASLLTVAVTLGNAFATVVLASILGACLGFLPHNWNPARIFMGDSGSQPLGFLLASISVYESMKSPTAVAILVPILALGVPVNDTLLVMLVRFMERPKGPLASGCLRIFVADRNHLHHRLASLDMSHRTVVRWIYLMVGVSCVLAFTVAFTKMNGLGWALVAVELVAVFLVRELGLARRAEDLSHRQRRKLHEELQMIGTPPETAKDR